MRLFRLIFLAVLLVFCGMISGYSGDEGAVDGEFPDQIVSLELKDMDILEALKYIAANRPMGRAKIIAPKTKYIVPTIAGNIPPLRIPCRGISERNCQFIAGRPF